MQHPFLSWCCHSPTQHSGACGSHLPQRKAEAAADRRLASGWGEGQRESVTFPILCTNTTSLAQHQVGWEGEKGTQGPAMHLPILPPGQSLGLLPSGTPWPRATSARTR